MTTADSLLWYNEYQALLKILDERDNKISELRNACKFSLAALEENAIPSPHVDGARGVIVRAVKILREL